MSEMNNRLVLVTGATGGLGKEMVKSFLKEGANLVISDLNKEDTDRMLSEMEFIGRGKILNSIESDLSSEKGCDKLYADFRKIAEAPDILVNNAGIAVLGAFADVPSKKWEAILNINLYAPMRLVHKFLPTMLERQSGHIVNVSSVAGLVAVPHLNTYSVSKFGIKAFGEALYGEVKDRGVNVTNFYPFFTRTPILQSEQIGIKNEMKVPEFLLSEPEDVIRDLIRGIKSNQLHVHPGGISKTLDIISRFLPGVVNSLTGVFVNNK